MHWRATLRKRAMITAILIGVWMTAIEARLVFLQVVEHRDLVARATRQQMSRSNAAAKRVAALSLDGVGFIKEDRRFYPNKELAAHLLGYVGLDNQGLNGLEFTYDAQIRGKAGTVLVQTDARRRAFARFERPPTAGST